MSHHACCKAGSSKDHGYEKSCSCFCRTCHRRDRPPRPSPGPRPGWDGGPDRRPGWGDDYGRRDIMSPRRIARSLERRGYDVGDMRLNRDTYFVRATRPNGRRVIVMVDAYSGRIVGERRPGGY